MAVIKTILALIPFCIDLVNWIKELTKDDPDKFIRDLHEAVVHAKQTKDPSKIQDILKRL